MSITILGIESSCDDTSAAIIRDGYLLSNVIADQEVHKKYGGVVPELASRAHQQNIIPVVDQAIKQANVMISDINAVAFTRGPGLIGSLLVGTSFAKGFSLFRNIPLIEVNHLMAHVLVHFIKMPDSENKVPAFPFLCLLVSGGHTQIILVKDYLQSEVLGCSIDDAAGEAFDKSAKILGLPYPGGPYIDKLSKKGNSDAYTFSKPKVENYNYSFSGLKTSFLYFVRDQLYTNENFIEENKSDLAASLQKTIIDILLEKLEKASNDTKINQIAIAGGVSANSGLRKTITTKAKTNKWTVFLPDIGFTTDNAAMIGIVGYYKYLGKQFSDQNVVPVARFKI
ncbi:MAG: tRNA (adenosine(37)-N6)-threonylcarbamoyltransferase complex transferase subunit TsaD [Bacteroidota bacterium]